MSSDGQLTNLKLAPGVYKNTTSLAAEGRYVDCDKVRWFYGNPQKIGGCVNETVFQHDVATSSSFTGVPRDILSWQNNEADLKFLAVATNRKLEIFSQGEIWDVTPIRYKVTLADVISTSTGSPYVTLSVAGHAASQYDYVVLQSVASSVGGITFSGQYEIVSVIDADHFMISAPSATTTSAGAGGSATLTFLMNIGLSSNTAATGWGSGGYGRQGWGTALSVTTGDPVLLDQWQIENWGEDALFCRRGGRIYTWVEERGLEAVTPDRASVRSTMLSAAPSINNTIIVSQPSRHLLSFGCTDLTGNFDPLLIRWSNQEDYTTWDPTVSVAGGNTSGSQRVKGGSQIVGAVQTRGEILVMTDAPVHILRYSGDPFIFSIDQIADNAGGISQHCMIDVQGDVYWMGLGAFYRYNGRVEVVPCDIQEVLFEPGNRESINFNQKEKIFAGINSRYNEVIWLYPSENSDEIDRYVIYNYLEKVWYDGTLDRTVWEDSGVFEKPYALNPTGTLFIHEEGKDLGSQTMDAFVETSFFDLQDGDDIMFVDKLVPDFRRIPNNKQITMTVQTKRYSQDSEVMSKGPFPVTNNTRKVSMRARGRQMKVRIDCKGNGSDFELGLLKLNILPDGKR